MGLCWTSICSWKSSHLHRLHVQCTFFFFSFFWNDNNYNYFLYYSYTNHTCPNITLILNHLMSPPGIEVCTSSFSLQLHSTESPYDHFQQVKFSTLENIIKLVTCSKPWASEFGNFTDYLMPKIHIVLNDKSGRKHPRCLVVFLATRYNINYSLRHISNVIYDF